MFIDLADRFAAEQAEKERLAKEEAERLASEKSARLAELKANALKYGLSEEEATTYANNNLDQMNGMDNSNLYILVYDKVKAQALDAGFSEQEANDIANQYSIWNTPNMTLADTAKIIENLAVDKAEKERLAKEEAERLAAEEKARQEKLASLVAIAKEAGLTDSQAMQVAKNNMTSSEEQFIQAIETFKIDSAKGFSSNTYRQGFNHLNYAASASASNSCVNSVCTSWSGTTTTGETLYNQKYSVVSGDYSARQGRLNGSWIDESSFSNIQVKGLKTQKDAIPNEGAATYSGKAFEGQTAGDLTYNVDFATRVGSGSVSGLPVGQVTLGEAKINGTALSGKANNNGNYRLEFFGPNAEEIGGKMSLDGNNYGLAGSRGEIQK